MRDQANRHEQFRLSEAEAAFYDAIVQNDAAVLELGLLAVNGYPARPRGEGDRTDVSSS